MRIAILGATSQIARDLIASFQAEQDKLLYLFARRPDEVTSWLKTMCLTDQCLVDDFSGFASYEFDAIINFVGAGNPARVAAMGNSIFDVTSRFDCMVLDYLKKHPTCRYLFLSSGAIYGSNFSEPANRDTPAIVPVNNLTVQDWYGVAKLHAECRHRAHAEFPIVDIRVFNYFSHSQDISARFLITDIVRAISNDIMLKTSAAEIVRDYLHPSDFFRLVSSLLSADPINTAVDCYSRAPIDKASLLSRMQKQFGLRYEFTESNVSVNATGTKPHYYSLNTCAAELGYQPALSSLDGIVQEATVILGQPKPQVNIH
jgi:nucleoside-diphosphate-sugar epimerase